MEGITKAWLILLALYLRERENVHILITALMKEDGIKDNFMVKEGLLGLIIHSIMEIIRLARKVGKELSFIHQEKPIKEAGSKEDNKEKEPFLARQAKSSKKDSGAMEYSHSHMNSDDILKRSVIFDYYDDNDRIKIYLKGSYCFNIDHYRNPITDWKFPTILKNS